MDRSRVARLRPPGRMARGSTTVFVREAAPRLEAHDAVWVKEEEGSPVRLQGTEDDIHAGLVDFIRRGVAGHGGGNPVHTFQLPQVGGEFGGGPLLGRDIARETA